MILNEDWKHLGDVEIYGKKLFIVDKGDDVIDITMNPNGLEVVGRGKTIKQAISDTEKSFKRYKTVYGLTLTKKTKLL